MALKRGSSSSNLVLLCIFLALFAIPCFAKGKVDAEGIDTEIYEIDYRGPETHTYTLPPPSKGRAGAHSKSKGPVTARRTGPSAKKIYG
ncbi:hypothetical protein DCAR_0625499 [Daucus carota subsp. sativus]|uniref:Transmembrane protein n=1 Tax=Daucus carota subsp. sativus TaxID=79200 RepID=A0AAF0XGM2_DAUCS|nr:hypothetical protein DCAR_0625499 [Daucus carota subsp. sativus]